MATTPNLHIPVFTGIDKISRAVFNSIFATLDGLGVAYVTEKGTSGAWYWRKWSDGRAEAWCSVALSSVPVDVDWGTLKRSGEVGRQALPIAFADVPHMTASWATNDNNIAIVAPYSGPSTTSTGSFMLVRGESGTTSGTLSIHVSETV